MAPSVYQTCRLSTYNPYKYCMNKVYITEKPMNSMVKTQTNADGHTKSKHYTIKYADLSSGNK